MVVGDQHFQAQGLRLGHAFNTGNAVVDRDQYIRTAGVHALGNRCGQAIAVDHPVGHDVAHLLGAQQTQSTHGHGAGGRAIAVVIGHDAQALIGLDRVGQQAGCSLHAQQARGR